MDTKINQLITHLQKTESKDLGPASGLMGQCLFLYRIGRTQQNAQAQVLAEQVLDRVLEKIDSISSVDLHHGLTGIGLGIDYLLKQQYVAGDPNTVLSDADSMVCRKLTTPNGDNNSPLSGVILIHGLHYLYQRYIVQQAGSEMRLLFEELMIHVFNELYSTLNKGQVEVLSPFSLDHPLPQLLYVWSELYALGFYNKRLLLLQEELSYRVFTGLPQLHSMRLLWLWGVDALAKQTGQEKWIRHARWLHAQINVEQILHEELLDKHISIQRGYAGIYVLLQALQTYYTAEQMQEYARRIYQAISHSEAWSLLQEEVVSDVGLGLYTGLCGAALVSDHIQQTFFIERV